MTLFTFLKVSLNKLKTLLQYHMLYSFWKSALCVPETRRRRTTNALGLLWKWFWVCRSPLIVLGVLRRLSSLQTTQQNTRYLLTHVHAYSHTRARELPMYWLPPRFLKIYWGDRYHVLFCELLSLEQILNEYKRRQLSICWMNEC